MPKCDFNKVAKQLMDKGCRLWRNLFPAEKSILKKCREKSQAQLNIQMEFFGENSSF